MHQRTLLCITTLTKILCTIMSTFFCFTRIVNLPLLAISIYLSNHICRAGATVDLVLSDPLLSLVGTHCCLLSNSLYVEFVVAVYRSHCCHTTWFDWLLHLPADGRTATQGPCRSPGDLAGAWTSEVTAKAVKASSARTRLSYRHRPDQLNRLRSSSLSSICFVSSVYEPIRCYRLFTCGFDVVITLTTSPRSADKAERTFVQFNALRNCTVHCIPNIVHPAVASVQNLLSC